MTTKRDLQKQGFRQVPEFATLYIDRAGHVYDRGRGRYLSPRPKNRVLYGVKLLSVPKLLLSAFGKQPYNGTRQIRHLDGDRTHIALENLCYTPDRSTLRINYADLHTAIRCYFQVPKRYKATDRARTKLYLHDIAHRRGFLYGGGDRRALAIFGAYLDNPFWNLNRVADQYGITVRMCTETINPLISELIRDVLADHRAGDLQILDYQPRRKTTAQTIKEYNEFLTSHGIEPIKIPRKQSTAQILKEWGALKKEGENLCDSL